MVESSPPGGVIKKVDPVILEDDESVFKGFKINAKSKFTENAMTEQDYKSAVQKINAFNAKEWHLLEGRDNLLVYADKKNLNLSKSSGLSAVIRKF